MQSESVVASVRKPRYRAFPEHDNVEGKPPSRQMVAVLRCCVARGRVRNDSRPEFFCKSQNRIRLPRQLSALLRAFGARYEMRMYANSDRGEDDSA
jgi:hypothetical protein